jgi:hypothetical protein
LPVFFFVQAKKNGKKNFLHKQKKEYTIYLILELLVNPYFSLS